MAQCQRIIENKTPTCEFCTKSFLTEVNLMKHIKICSTPRKCCICSETFNGAKLLEEHFQKCKQSLNCKICKTTFKTKSETDNHIKEKHAQQDKFNVTLVQICTLLIIYTLSYIYVLLSNKCRSLNKNINNKHFNK